jgi:hypothetical protein
MQQRLVANHILKGLFIDKKPVRSQILKTRQLGNTTLMMALIYFMILKMPHYSCLVIMDRDEHGDDKRELIESWADAASQRFPTFAKIASRKGKTIRFSNGSLVTIDSSQSMSPGTSMMYKFAEVEGWQSRRGHHFSQPRRAFLANDVHHQ